MYEEEVAKKSKVERERRKRERANKTERGGMSSYHFLHLCIFSSSNYLLRFGRIVIAVAHYDFR